MLHIDPGPPNPFIRIHTTLVVGVEEVDRQEELELQAVPHIPVPAGRSIELAAAVVAEQPML